MRIIIYLMLMANLMTSLQASLLSAADVEDFIGNHEERISVIQRDYKVHRGYGIIEIAKQEMIKATADRVDYYRDVILSVLKGIGIKGGLSKTKKANPYERRMGYLALYAIGINIDTVTADSRLSHVDKATPAQRIHIDRCNELIQNSNSIRRDPVNFTAVFPEASRRFADLIEKTRLDLNGQNHQPKPSKAFKAADFALGGELDIKYRRLPVKLSFEHSLRKTLNGEKIFDQSAVRIFQDFKKVFTSKAYKEAKALIDGGERMPMTVWDGCRTITTACVAFQDIVSAKVMILDSMSNESSLLLGLFDINNQRKQLKRRVKNRTLQLMKEIHVDKLALDKHFEYDLDLVRLGNELNEILGQCKGISISRDYRGRLTYAVD